MKVSGNVKEITVTQSALARALNLSPPRIHQLIEEEIVVGRQLSAVKAEPFGGREFLSGEGVAREGEATDSGAQAGA